MRVAGCIMIGTRLRKGLCRAGGRVEARVLVESQMMLSGRALGSEDLQGSRKVDYIYV